MGYNPEHYQANKAKYAEKSKAWRDANPEKSKANRRANYLLNKDRDIAYSTVYNRLRKTGVSNEQYQKKLLDQDGVCAICKGTCTKALAADHDHDTGVFRGLLCNSCNRGLGYFKDNMKLLKEAYKYLENNQLVVPVKESCGS